MNAGAVVGWRWIYTAYYFRGVGVLRKISSIDYYRSSKTSISSRYLIFSASILEDFWYTPSGSLELSTYPALGGTTNYLYLLY
jgi:hypothetical protein